MPGTEHFLLTKGAAGAGWRAPWALHWCVFAGSAPSLWGQTPRARPGFFNRFNYTDGNPGMDFQIVIDSREKEQYAFSCSTVRRKLDAGDYSIAGHELSVAVERKSLPDFVHTVIHDFQRFAAELDKLKAMDAACVVVEADLDALLRDQHRETLRGVAPTSLLGMSLYISLRWTVPVYWCGSRQAACAFTDAYLRTFVRTQVERGGAQHG